MKNINNSIIMEDQKDIISQIDSEIDKAIDEATWGKPASDIITRIESMENAKPARAIWEMVQNARDVSKETGADIEFSLNDDEFVFRHNGLPFTATSLHALNIQTSSKVREGIVQVGQYGTGFLTTHKFGLKFNLTGSLELCNGSKYLDFDRLPFDRSPRDKKSMIDNLKCQQANIKLMSKDPDNVRNLKNTPREFTIFRYHQEHDIERERAREAFEEAPNLTPHVLALNELINSIRYSDETTGKESSYTRRSRKVLEENSLYTFSMVESHISRNYDDDKIPAREYDYQIYMLESAKKDERTGSSTVTVILPLLKETVEGVERVRAFRFRPDKPNFFIYLPLLGTENYGVNFIFHSPAFTCADESRSSLRFVGNGQNNDYQADLNREIIRLGEEMIFSFIGTHLDKFADRKMFSFVNINTQAGNQKLSDFLKEKKSLWVDMMNGYDLVRSSSQDGGYVKPSDIFGLSREMVDEGYRNSLFLDAVYGMLMTKYADRLPAKDEFLFWSDRIMEWYGSDVDNEHVITVQNVVNLITEKNDISTLGKENLLEFNKFLAAIKKFSFFENYAIVPNESGILKKKADLVCPSTFNKTTREVMAVLVPEDFAKFVDPDFAGLTQFTSFSDGDLKVKISDAISKIQDWQKSYRDKFRRYTISQSYSDRVSNPEHAIVSQDKVAAMIRFASMIIKPESCSNEAKILALVKEYHGFTEEVTDSINEFEVRSALRTLIADVMYRFTLNPEETKAAWAQKTVEAVYAYNDFRSMLRDYKLYQDQKGKYRYAEQLRKENEIPERLKEIYDTIVFEGNLKSIKDVLLDCKYKNCFEGDSECNGAELSARIFEKISSKRDGEEKSYPDISTYSHRAEVLEIIRRMDDSEEGRQWASLFSTLEKDKATVTMSVIDDGDKKDSIFKFMQEENTDKLKALADISEKVKSLDSLQAIADIASADDLADILANARRLNDERQEAERQFNFKYTIGKIIEDELRDAVNSELSCSCSASDIQNGQDMVISFKGEPIYFIECKAKWNFTDPAHMSSLQMKQAVREKGRYALCCVDCTTDTGAKVSMNASKDDVIAAHDDIIAHTYVHTDIGDVLSPAVSPIIKEEDTFRTEDESSIRVRGDLNCSISKRVFVKGMPFKEFISDLTARVREELAVK